MLRVLPVASFCLVWLASVSAQNDFPVDPRTALVVANRAAIEKLASGLPAPQSPGRVTPLSPGVLRSISEAAEAAVTANRTIRQQQVPPQSRENLPITFPFGPRLLSTPLAKSIGQRGDVFEEASRQVRARAAAAGGALPQVSPGINETLGCPFNQNIQCDSGAIYRTITGVCNNLRHKLWGSSNTPFERSVPPAYSDGLSAPRSQSVLSGNLPLPRVISTSFHEASNMRTLDRRFSHITMEFGQFLSHDMERFAPIQDDAGSDLVCCEGPNQGHPGCFPIDIPANDPFFSQFNRRCMEMVRAVGVPSLCCTLGPRQQLNQETAYIDASNVYGSTQELSDELRLKTGGLLKTGDSPDGETLLQDPTLTRPECRSREMPRRQCFKAGDARVNQQPALMSMHTLWLREHNRVARELSRLNPSWNDETIFQEARKIVSAEMQHVVYNEFLPTIVGQRLARAFDFPARSRGYHTDYQPAFNAQIRSSFSTSGYRFGHSLVQMFFAKNTQFQSHFLRPDIIYQRSRGTSFVIENLFSSKQQKCDRLISPQLTNTLLQRQPGTGIDLAATNIQRGRDFGTPSYNVFRKLCGLQPARHFGTGRGGLVDHTRRAARLLRSTYRHVDDIDLWTGAVSERVIRGAVVGRTVACIIGRQFFLLKKGDRFFYENNDRFARFPLNQLDAIRKTSFARIICDNTRVRSAQRDVFSNVNIRNPKVACSRIPGVDLTHWRACLDGGWSEMTPPSACFYGYRFQFRFCNNPPPSACGQPCRGPRFRYKSCYGNQIRNIFGPPVVDPVAVARQLAPSGVFM